MVIDRRRRLMTALVCSGALASPALAFDRVAQKKRYGVWLQSLRADLNELRRRVPDGEEVTLEHVAEWCQRSVVPGSRFAQNLAQLVTQARAQSNVPGRRHRGTLDVTLLTFRSAIPAGQGGMFPEPQDSGFSDGTLRVWYMHIHDHGHLAGYFKDPSHFDPYRLPPDGQLQRKAYPFLLFEDQPDRLRLGGVSAEWHGAVTRIFDIQFT